MRTLPIQTEYSGLESTTGLQAEQAQQNIREAIANLQAGSAKDKLAMDFALTQLRQNQSQFEATQRQQESQFGRTLDFNKSQNQSMASLDSLWNNF